MKAGKGMGHIAVWLCMSGAGFLYWAVVYRFASAQIDCFTAPVRMPSRAAAKKLKKEIEALQIKQFRTMMCA